LLSSSSSSLRAIGVIIYISRFLLTLLKNPLLAEEIGNLDSVLQSIPNVLITGAFIGIIGDQLRRAAAGIVPGRDMDFLLCRPVPIRAVFITKLLQAVLPSFYLICAVALPICLAWAGTGIFLMFYPLVLLELVVLSMAAAGFSSLLVMAVVRVFPARA